MAKKTNHKEILLNHTGIAEQDFNYLFEDIDNIFEQIDIYKSKSPYPIVFHQFDIFPKNGKEALPYDFTLLYTTQSKRKHNLFDKLKISETSNYLDTAFEDCFKIYIELFLSNEYFLPMKTIWGLTTQILNNTENDVDLLFEASPLFKYLKENGGMLMETADRLERYLWEVHEIECISNQDIFVKFDSKQRPTMVIGWNNLKEYETDPIVINTEYVPYIEEYFISKAWLDEDDEDL